MRVLWVANAFFPEAQALLTGKSGIVNGTGSWLTASAEALVNNDYIELAVVNINKSVSKLTRLQGEKIVYYVMPQGKGNVKLNKDYIPFWIEIDRDFNPDVIHLHGTELSHGWSLLKALPHVKTVISIQGLMSQICQYYTYGMSSKDILNSITIRDIVHDIVRRKEMCGTLVRRKKNFEIRGCQELLIYQQAKAVIGRTQWDNANVMAINPKLDYYFCNETLRTEFYEGQWDYNKCQHHTIFLSQATYPFKGLHMMIKAMPLILTRFPDTKIVVAGIDILGGNNFKSHLLRTGYAKYIKKLMKRLDIKSDCIRFTGPLDAEGMKKEYLNCNVFVSPSAIENSPNSVCEAQMLGVPVIASYVGGTPDMIPNEKCGYLYRFEDIEMLAALVNKVFEKSNSHDGTYEISVAHTRHDRDANFKQLMNIYHTILNAQ